MIDFPFLLFLMAMIKGRGWGWATAAEIKRVTRERDAAVRDINAVLRGEQLVCAMCDQEICPEYGNEEMPDRYCDEAKWRGTCGWGGITMAEWISVKDGLPKKIGEYLVNVHQETEDGDFGDVVLNAWYTPIALPYVPQNIGWTLLNEFYSLTSQMKDDITHWMPLPEPPQESLEDETDG